MMAHTIMIRDIISQHIVHALASARNAGELPDVDVPAIHLARSRMDGVDYATSIAMQLARTAKLPPAKIALVILRHLPHTTDYAAQAVNGYVNFSLSAAYLSAQVEHILEQPTGWGNSHIGQGKKAQVEHGSANPTK